MLQSSRKLVVFSERNMQPSPALSTFMRSTMDIVIAVQSGEELYDRTVDMYGYSRAIVWRGKFDFCAISSLSSDHDVRSFG